VSINDNPILSSETKFYSFDGPKCAKIMWLFEGKEREHVRQTSRVALVEGGLEADRFPEKASHEADLFEELCMFVWNI
jgi:hypothetical protein